MRIKYIVLNFSVEVFSAGLMLILNSWAELCSVDKSVLILSRSPYKDQNPNIGPYLVLIFLK